LKRSAIKPRRRTKHQARNEQNRPYVEWLHTQPCCACRTWQNIQAAHVGVGGMGLKHGDDDCAIPLCGPRWLDGRVLEGCHAQHDQRKGRFSLDEYTRAHLQEWDAQQIANHRARFLAEPPF
jgi:hypothetical protein